MRNPLEIVAELKNVTHWSQPNIKYNETMALLNELEAALNPTQPIEKTVEKPVVEKTFEEVISDIVEEVFPEVTEETPTKTTKKTKK